MSESKPDYIYNVSDNICKKKSKRNAIMVVFMNSVVKHLVVML